MVVFNTLHLGMSKVIKKPVQAKSSAKDGSSQELLEVYSANPEDSHTHNRR